jgi:uncharacterized protein VirK/YbjX
MATDENIEELLQAFVSSMSKMTFSELRELSKKSITAYEETQTINNRNELINIFNVYLSDLILLCEKYNSKDINLYQRFNELTNKIKNYEKYYANDLTLRTKETEELKELLEILNLALGREDMVSRAIKLHYS